MTFKPDQYIKVKTIEEVTVLLQEYSEKAAIVAGGTLLHELAMKGMIPGVRTLIDIEQLNLDYIVDGGSGIKIGACTKLCDIRDESLFKQEGAYTALSEAATILPIQIVELATIGGAVCAGVPILNFPPVMVALDAEFKVVSAGEEKRIPASEFFIDYFLTALNPTEFMTEILIPKLPEGTGSVFQAFKILTVDYPTVSIAAKVTLDGNGTCDEVRLVFGSVGHIPVRATKAESKLKGKKLEDGVIKEVLEVIPEEIEPISDLRASAEYRKELSKVLTESALIKARERAIWLGG